MKLHDFPILLTLAGFAFSCVVVFLTDTFAMPAAINAQNRTERSWWRLIYDWAVRIPVIVLIYAAFFAISWRPIYSTQAVISFFVIFTGISRAKFEFIREPLVFSDIALVVDVFKYKEIFYATSLNVFFWMIAFVYVFGLSGLYMYWEPSVLPAENGVLWVLLMLAVAFSPWLALFSRIVSEPVCRFTQKFLGKVDVKIDTVRFGTFASVVFHFVIWVGVRREAIVTQLSERFISALHELWEHGDDEPLIVIWQSESFIDLRHFGVESVKLPNLDRLRDQAAQWGRMTSVFEGVHAAHRICDAERAAARKRPYRCELSLSARQPLQGCGLAGATEEGRLEDTVHSPLRQDLFSAPQGFAAARLRPDDDAG